MQLLEEQDFLVKQVEASSVGGWYSMRKVGTELSHQGKLVEKILQRNLIKWVKGIMSLTLKFG